MKIKCITGRGYDSNIYLIDGEKPTIIDCGTGINHQYVVKEIEKNISIRDVEQIILTHEHYDHVGGTSKIKNLTPKAKIFSHEKAIEKLKSGESMFATMIGGEMPKIQIDKILKNNDEILVGDNKYNIIHTPGHTPASICLYSKKDKTLFSGDTIFSHGSFGRYDLPGGNLQQLKESIKKISKLDVENIYPGHQAYVEGEANKHIMSSFRNVNSLY